MNCFLELLTDIDALAGERTLNSPEIHSPNDWYGHADVLKRYAGWPRTRAIHAAIEHSFALNPQYVWDEDLKGELPGIIVFSKERCDFMRAITTRLVEAIGPIIHYANPIVDEVEIERLRRELGSVLLAFPVHSTHHVNADFNIARFCGELQRLGKEYCRVMICLGWKDVLRGFGDFYTDSGFTCVTAGHMFDPLFLPRLKTIISLADMTVSTNFSSHVGYCIHLGKPHAIIDTDISFVSPSHEIHERDASCMESIMRKQKTPLYRSMIDPFRIFSTVITPEQKAVIRRHFGEDNIKQAQEMHVLFEELERMAENRNNACKQLSFKA